jgi:hypothetical protein
MSDLRASFWENDDEPLILYWVGISDQREFNSYRKTWKLLVGLFGAVRSLNMPLRLQTAQRITGSLYVPDIMKENTSFSKL